MEGQEHKEDCFRRDRDRTPYQLSQRSWTCGMFVAPEARQGRWLLGKEERQVEAEPSSTAGAFIIRSAEDAGVFQQGSYKMDFHGLRKRCCGVKHHFSC